MSAEAEIDGIHDNLRRAYLAALEDEWEQFDKLVLSARSEGLKRKAELAQRGQVNV